MLTGLLPVYNVINHLENQMKILNKTAKVIETYKVIFQDEPYTIKTVDGEFAVAVDEKGEIILGVLRHSIEAAFSFFTRCHDRKRKIESL